jgi:hypothetical protein
MPPVRLEVDLFFRRFDLFEQIKGTGVATGFLSVGFGPWWFSDLIDRVAAGPPIRKFAFIEALGHVRLPFAGFRPDHGAGVELAAIDPHRAAEAVADLEG